MMDTWHGSEAPPHSVTYRGTTDTSVYHNSWEQQCQGPHLVQGWLTVKQHGVAIDKVSLHDEAGLQLPVLRILTEPKVNARAVAADDKPSAWVLEGPIVYHDRQLTQVVLGNPHRNRQCRCNGTRDADLATKDTYTAWF